jgi:plastocyanin
MSLLSVVAFLLIVVTTMGCSSGSSGGSYTGGSSGNPNTPTPSANATTIDVLGQKGANSFAPNPASVTQGMMVVWHNSDNTPHHILLNDGSLDTGTIAPGASSPTRALTVSGANYHCTIHPTMVGSINVPTNSPSPGPGY